MYFKTKLPQKNKMDHTSKIRMKSVTKYVRKTQTFKHFIEQDDGKDNIEEGYLPIPLCMFQC